MKELKEVKIYVLNRKFKDLKEEDFIKEAESQNRVYNIESISYAMFIGEVTSDHDVCLIKQIEN
jgi:predicted membrane protein